VAGEFVGVELVEGVDHRGVELAAAERDLLSGERVRARLETLRCLIAPHTILELGGSLGDRQMAETDRSRDGRTRGVRPPGLATCGRGIPGGVASDQNEPDEIVYENGDTRTVERKPDVSLDYPPWIERLGHWFRLRRREVVSQSGERTHNRVTYRSEDRSSGSSSEE
jgi:hypothetical protein